MATTFYLPSSGTPPPSVTPTPDAAWDDITDLERLPCFDVKQGTTMTDKNTINSSEDDQDVIRLQYITISLPAQTISAQAIRLQIRASEVDSENNLFVSFGVRAVSSDGGTVRGTLLAVTRDTVNQVVEDTETNRSVTGTTTSVTLQANDRLVFELGLSGNPDNDFEHSGTLRVGDASASDLPNDDSSTSDFNPYIIFANTITMPSSGMPFQLHAEAQYLNEGGFGPIRST